MKDVVSVTHSKSNLEHQVEMWRPGQAAELRCRAQMLHRGHSSCR